MPVIAGVLLARPSDGTSSYSPKEIRALGKRFDCKDITAAFKITKFGPGKSRLYRLLKDASVAKCISPSAREILTYLIGSNAMEPNSPRVVVH